MRITSSGDWHLGTECDDDIYRVIDGNICPYIEKEKPDLAVLTGDIYNSNSTPDAREMAKELTVRIANSCPVVIIKGNHDAPKDLLILGSLRSKFKIVVYETPEQLIFPTEGEPVMITFMPWFTKAGWIAGRQAAGENVLSIESGDQTVGMMGLAYLKALVARTPGLKHILFSHMMINGARAENHQPLLGTGITLGQYDLVEAGFSAAALGHIHLAQRIGVPDETIKVAEVLYNGSPSALSYGERNSKKFFSILDTQTMHFETIPLQSVPRLLFEATWDGTLKMELEQNQEESFLDIQGIIKHARVLVRATISEGYNSNDAKAAIQEEMEKMGPPKSLKIESQYIPISQVRSAAISIATTASSKLKAFWGARGNTPEEPMKSEMLEVADQIEHDLVADHNQESLI